MIAPSEIGSVAGGGAIAQAVVGASDSVLNWLHAFCVTEACKNSVLAQAQAGEMAELAYKGQELDYAAAQLKARSGARTQQTIVILGAGALGLAALWILGR